MKNLRTIFLLTISISLLVSEFTFALGNDQPDTDDQHFSVIIGAFAIHRNAERFTNQAHHSNFNAKFKFNPNRNLFYVYTLTTDEKEVAMAEAQRLRRETVYIDAWVYQGILGEEKKSINQDIDPVTRQPMKEIPVISEVPVVNEVAQSQATPSVEPPVVEPPVERKSVFTPVGEDGKKFFFKFYNATNNEPINGEVEAIDTDRARKMGSFKTNETISLPSPKNTTGNITLVSNTFGYRKVLKELNYVEPEGEGITNDENAGIVVPFEMVRLRKGDIVVMYNVFFYKDAAVMLPESRFEVENLLSMMKENPKCKIRIHGHTNGNGTGRIISMGDPKNFFSLTGTTQKIGTAKALSQERANTIRAFLLNNGINENRMEVKAWGGKRPLYDKDSAKAKENVRVEIEILEE